MTATITPTEEKMLLILSDNLSLGRTECARLAGVSSGSIARVVTNMIDKGLAEYAGTSHRKNEISITHKGLRMLADSERRRAHSKAPAKATPPRTHAHIHQHYVPEPCVYRNDGLKHILSHGVRC